jgi:hypothetical protein
MGDTVVVQMQLRNSRRTLEQFIVGDKVSRAEYCLTR